MPSFLYPKRTFDPAFSGTADAAITGTTEQSIIPAGQGAMTMSPAWMQPGNTARLILNGYCSSILTPGSITFRIKLNGATIVTGALGGLLGLQTDAPFYLAETLAIRQTGPTGKAAAGGRVQMPVTLLVGGQAALGSKAQLTLDTTIPQTLDATVQFSLGGNSLTVTTCTFEMLEL